MTDQDKIERYDLIVGYFQKILNKRADDKIGDFIYYDEWKQPRYMDETERENEAIEEFESEMDNIGFFEFAELMAHDIYGESVSKNNQFYDHVYGERPTERELVPMPVNKKAQAEYNKKFGIED